jgi:hypothetical protein
MPNTKKNNQNIKTEKKYVPELSATTTFTRDNVDSPGEIRTLVGGSKALYA